MKLFKKNRNIAGGGAVGYLPDVMTEQIQEAWQKEKRCSDPNGQEAVESHERPCPEGTWHVEEN